MSQPLRLLSPEREDDAEPSLEPGQHRVATLVGVEAGRFLVDLGDGQGPRAARSTLGLSPDAMHKAAAAQREALVALAQGTPALPIVLGLLDAEPTEPVAPVAQVEAEVDGKRVLIDAQDEIVLRCGEASITLRRNGRVIIQGAQVETRARGVNRIKGGSVQIN